MLWGKIYVIALVTTHQMVTGKKAKGKFKAGICTMAKKSDVDDPDTITVNFDRHVLVKIKEAAEEKIMKIEERRVTLEERKEKIPEEEESNYSLWKSIRDRIGACLVQGKLQKKN